MPLHPIFAEILDRHLKAVHWQDAIQPSDLQSGLRDDDLVEEDEPEPEPEPEEAA